MYNLCGIIYRLCTQCGIMVFLGLSGLYFILRDKEDRQRTEVVIAIVLTLAGALFYGAKYISCLTNPQIEVFEGKFREGYSSSHVAPPSPFNWEYTFLREDRSSTTFYIDIFSKKEIYNKDFVQFEPYRIYYEAETRIIVKVEYLGD